MIEKIMSGVPMTVLPLVVTCNSKGEFKVCRISPFPHKCDNASLKEQKAEISNLKQNDLE